MQVVRGSSANELFVRVSRLILEDGVESSPRSLLTKELANVWLVLENPKECLVTLPERGMSFDYLDGEMDWYLSGSLRVDDIVGHSKFWRNLADADGRVNSNYGYLAFHEQVPTGGSQYDWCVGKIREDPDTRQAVINYNQPRHKYTGNKDFVCTMFQSFRQHGGSIDTTVVMRSNDLIYGLTYDINWFSYLLRKLCDDTGYSVGVYNHIALSLHVYERHFSILRRMAEAVL